MGNKIRFYQTRMREFVIERNTKPIVAVNRQIKILPELKEIAKDFFPEPFEYIYSVNLNDETIAGLETFRDGYNLGASHYINQLELNKQLETKNKELEAKLAEITTLK